MLRPGDRWIGNAAATEPVTVTLLLRPNKDISQALLSGTYHPGSREDAEKDTAADPVEIAAVRQFADQHGLTVTSTDIPSRRVVLSGDAQHMQQAFGVELGQVQDQAGHTFLTYRGAIKLPPSLASSVTAVLGLDQRPVARHAGNQ